MDRLPGDSTAALAHVDAGPTVGKAVVSAE